jgi:hypothetical protein
MNEELMKQLVEILKQLKDGTPGAWQELVHQRQLYCFSSGASLLLFSLILGIIGVFLGKKGVKMYNDSGRGYDDTYMFFAFGWAIAAIGSLVTLVCGGESIINGIAPLGQVLSKLN